MKQFLKALNQFSSSGVSLVQILMTSSAIAGLALVGLRMAEDQKKLVDETYETYLSEYFLAEVNNVLESELDCTQSLKGLDPLNSELKTLKIVKGKKTFDVLPAIGFEGSKGSYFEDRLKVLSYKLFFKDEEVANVKGFTNFVVTLQLSQTSKKVIKKIPLDFSKDENGFIKTCRRQLNSQLKEVKGFWKKDSKGMRLENLAVVIGDGPKKNSLFTLNGGLFLERTGNELTCNPDTEGILTTGYDFMLKVCIDGAWKNVGEYPINWLKRLQYTATISTSGTTRKRTRNHRLCFVSGQSRKSLSDKCLAERVDDEFRSEYVISAVTSSQVTKNVCEVICVD
ncbi:MAG: hypothetical protein NXH75_06480 [Halobacteriovoraceae bacterium]|nr:hypothetical protein [Halobacteriovoraceae bacterium]